MKNLIITLAALVLVGAGASVAKAQSPFGPKNSGSSTDPDTGVTTTSQLNPDGSRTITKTDSDGIVISTETIRPVRPGVRPPRRPRMPLGGSTTWNGETIIVLINEDGSRTIIRFDENGKETGRSNSKDEPVTKAGPKPVVGGSSTDHWTGETTTVERNADGSRKIIKTDADGKETGRSNSKDEPVTKAGPKPVVGGSSTDPWTGETTTVERNADGSRKITKTDAEGKEKSVEKKDAPKEDLKKKEIRKVVKK